MHPAANLPTVVVAMIALSALAACNEERAPTGQVVAIVNGEDVTRREVQAELTATPGSDATLSPALQPALVDRIFTRKLLAQEARRQGLDKTPDFLAAEQRARESLMSRMLIARWSRQPPRPDAAAIQAFVAANPHRFQDRQTVSLDQIRTRPDGVAADRLTSLTGADAVAAYLTAQRQPFQRSRFDVDTATLPADVGARLVGLAPGAVFPLRQGNILTINVVAARRPHPVPAPAQAALATRLITHDAVSRTVKAGIDKLRDSAQVSYQRDFTPPARP